jgi:hypothetical protein
MQDFDLDAGAVQLASMDRDQIQHTWFPEPPPPVVHDLEPAMPFEHQPWRAYRAAEPFDVVCLAQSKAFTPEASDALFADIRERFIDETAFP